MLKLSSFSSSSESIQISSPNQHHYQTHLSHLQNCKTQLDIKQIHALSIKTSTFFETPIFSKLLSLYSDPKIGNLEYARSVFDQIEKPNSFAWNTIIKSYIENHRSNDGLVLFCELLNVSDILPDHFILPCVIKGCTRLSAIEEGKQIHGLVFKIGLVSDAYVQCSLISFYSKAADILSSQKVFYSVDDRNLGCSNSLLDGYARCGEMELAQKLFDEMSERDSFSWTVLIDGYSKCGKIEIARKLFDQMPNKCLVTWNAMINGYMKSGDFESAERLFNRMPERNLVTWNSMVSGYEWNGKYMQALEFFQTMVKGGPTPNNSTLVSVLSAVSGLALIEKGRWIHSYINWRRLRFDGVLGTSLIEMYSKCGCIESALNVFQAISKKKLGHWTAIIVGLGAHGMANHALELFMEMQRMGVKPHPITFIGVLNACSHAGMIQEGYRYFELMKQEYMMEPMIEHYGCLVDLLCRAGRLEDAMNVIVMMPMKPNKVIWMSLLSGCKIHGNIDIGEYAAKHAFELAPKDIGSYVLLSNIYAAAGQWDKVSMVRKNLKARGVKKVPGCSFIEHNDKLHKFIVGDRSHPQTEEIYSKLSEMRERLICAGYIPDLTQVLLCIEGEKEKEAELSNHSERLAIAFGLINLEAGRPICIVKNLRVCNDCHNVTKLLSSIYDREIIVRDNSRFHHFKKGFCSCMDYW
ncbi:Pentatricopeptide repeat-containing protein [Thalictrum thalictroides]|uniref:Pentatricopeptide repeat-containing protein n=1 Tax=Thalictrum thalictroides TaxID=46969 RepID=A0A7J6WMS7_THATH|nr:Pentatricopeptide repeat-containing protein [Thalictrum thalictroides]